MKRIIISLLALAVAHCLTGCGPKCLEVKTAMSAEELEYDDAMRVNKLVDLRQRTVASAENDSDMNTFALEDHKFSVTAYELAAETMLRVINLESSGNPLYEEHRERIDAARCDLDKILEMKEEEFLLGKASGRDIQAMHAGLKALFRKEGEVSRYQLKDTLKDGLKAKRPASLDAPEDEQASKKEKKTEEAEEDEEENDEVYEEGSFLEDEESYERDDAEDEDTDEAEDDLDFIF